jgi:hypothetical protein
VQGFVREIGMEEYWGKMVEEGISDPQIFIGRKYFDFKKWRIRRS